MPHIRLQNPLGLRLSVGLVVLHDQVSKGKNQNTGSMLQFQVQDAIHYNTCSKSKADTDIPPQSLRKSKRGGKRVRTTVELIDASYDASFATGVNTRHHTFKSDSPLQIRLNHCGTGRSRRVNCQHHYRNGSSTEKRMTTLIYFYDSLSTSALLVTSK